MAGWPVVLLHGFSYDPRCYDDVAAIGGSTGRCYLDELVGTL